MATRKYLADELWWRTIGILTKAKEPRPGSLCDCQG